VLLVDDDPAFAEMVADALEHQSDAMTVQTVSGGRTALDRLAEGDVDAVVSDYAMPGTDGLELLDAVRAEYPNLPFILLTGKGSEDTASTAVSRGADDYIQKGTGIDLGECDTERAVCDLTVEAAENILEFDICVVDIEEGGLLPTRAGVGLPSGGTPTMSVEEGIAGKTYRTGESFLVDDAREVAEADPQGEYLSALSVPLGDHGVFQAGAREVGAFDESDLQLAELLVAHTAGALDRVARALDRMDALVADVLTMARQGRRVEQPDPVALHEMVDEAWTTTDPAGDLRVAFDDVAVLADPGRLRQVFENLFRNAVEHAGPAVTVRVGLLDDRRGFFVADDGPGIPEDERDDGARFEVAGIEWA